MPKQSRRRGSPATQSAAAANASSAADGPEWWTQLEEPLNGLLTVETSEPFVDLDHLCPLEAKLVIHLDLLRSTPNIRTITPFVERALHALATLCVESERLRWSESQYEAFWRRVLTSDMAREIVQPNDASITRFARHTRFKGLHVRLSWSGRKFQRTVTKQLRGFLDAPLSKYYTKNHADSVLTASHGLHPRPLAVGLCFAHCGLSTDDLVAIKEMLTLPSMKTSERVVCRPDSVVTLDLDGNVLGSTELKVVTSILAADNHTRRIDGLGLKETFPSDGTAGTEHKYVTAFTNVLATLFTASAATVDHAVSLSLANNDMFDGVHLHALYESLKTASRPIKALSLARTSQKTNAWNAPNATLGQMWFARICMTAPTAAITSDCKLDISMAGSDLIPDDMDDFSKHLLDTITVEMPAINAVLTGEGGGLLVRVRSRRAYETPEISYNYSNSLTTSEMYQVAAVRADGWMEIVLPEDEDDEEEAEDDEGVDGEAATDATPAEEVIAEPTVAGDDGEQQDGDGDQTSASSVATKWIPVTSIRYLHIGTEAEGAVLIGMRFRELIWHVDVDQFTYRGLPELTKLLGFLDVVGDDIHRLSLRSWNDSRRIRQVLSCCRKVQDLDLQSSRVEADAWSSFIAEEPGEPEEDAEEDDDPCFPMLQAINLSHTGVSVESLDAFKSFLGQAQVRYWSLLDNKLGTQQLTCISQILENSQSIQLVELDAISPPSLTTAPAEVDILLHDQMLAIASTHDKQHLHATVAASAHQKQAFFSVLASLNHPQQHALYEAAFTRCCEYAGGVAVRRIQSCAPIRLSGWYPKSTRDASGA